MACTLISLDNACVNAFGGIYVSYAAPAADIDEITFDGDGQVTAITMENSANFAKYQYTQDDTAYYNQEGNRDGNLHEFEQEAFFKFLGISLDNKQFVDSLVECCDLVFIHVLRGGTKLMQGIEYDPDNEEWMLARNSAKVTGNVMSGLPSEESRVEATINSTANWSSPLVDMTIEALDTLAGIT